MEKKLNIVIQKKDFDVNQPLNIPKVITNYEINGSYLYIAPEKASYFSTNSIGNKIFESFRKGYTIKEVIQNMRDNSYSETEINNEIKKLLIKLEKNGFYEDANVVDSKEDQKGLQLYLTNKCNLKCCHCYIDAGTKNKKELTISQWENILDEYSNTYEGKVTFTGGEPLLYPGIYDLLKKAKSNGLTVELFTNGTLINEKNVKKVVEYLDMVQVSLDGASAQINDKIRGNGVWKKVVHAVNLMGKIKPQMLIVIAMTIMPGNAKDIEENIDKLLKLFKFEVRLKIGLLIITGRADKNLDFPNNIIAEQVMTKILNGIYKKRLKGMRKITPNMRIHNCGYGEIITILSNGEIYPCALPNYGIGNIRNISLSQAMETFLKNKTASNIENLEICSCCDVRYFCFGGCRLNYITKNNSLFKPYCTEKIKREMLEKLVL
ncbi:MAG: radical SAM protein [Planctomycetes bacterium]|nr:radical SAM protein [Acidobacteriota bacterium]MBU4401040.1 radical SAM protein [Planctomycetota bacterium]